MHATIEIRNLATIAVGEIFIFWADFGKMGPKSGLLAIFSRNLPKIWFRIQVHAALYETGQVHLYTKQIFRPEK